MQDWQENCWTSECNQPGVRVHQEAEYDVPQSDFIGGKHSEGFMILRGVHISILLERMITLPTTQCHLSWGINVGTDIRAVYCEGS